MRAHLFHHVARLAAPLAILIATAVPARAQQSQGPLQILPIENRVIIAPDVKITQINGATGTMVGAYAGVEIDERFFAGGAAYWLADADDAAEMFYVGFLMGWQVVNTERFHLGGRGLLGVGEATAYFNTFVPLPVPMPGPRHGSGFAPVYGRYGWETGIFVAEPEIRAEIGINRQFRVGLGVGYRWTSADAWLGNRLDGVTGSISLQIGLK
jgi:hypothetical protein